MCVCRNLNFKFFFCDFCASFDGKILVIKAKTVGTEKWWLEKDIVTDFAEVKLINDNKNSNYGKISSNL